MVIDTLLDSPKLTGSQPLKILLVDDEPATLQLVRRMLQADGHDLYEATDANRPSKYLTKFAPIWCCWMW